MKNRNLSSVSVLQILFSFFLFFTLFSMQAQTHLVAELTGNPVDTADWTMVGIDIEGEEVVLTQAASSQVGAIYYSTPYNLNQCVKWKVEFDFRMWGGNPHADGMAFWYLENPPATLVEGGAIGMPSDGKGLKVVFDTYDNDNYDFANHRANPEIQVYYGLGYSEENSVIPHDHMLLQYWPGLFSNNYQHAEIIWDNGEIQIFIDGILALNGDVTAYDGADQIAEGYFGFSASTGLYFDRHSIKNVKVYNNGVDLDQSEMEFASCDLFDGEGMGLFNLTLVEGEMAANGSYSYHMSAEDAHIGQNAIGNPGEFYNFEPWNQTIYVRIENEEGCFSVGEIHLNVLTSPVPEVEEVTLSLCANEGEAIVYDLTLAEANFLSETDGFEFTYYLSGEDAEEGNDSLENPEAYESEGNETIYVRIEEPTAGCYTVVQIHLTTFDPPALEDLDDLQACGNDGVFEYDLTLNQPFNESPNRTMDTENLMVSYYLSEEDALTGNNPIENPGEFILETAGCQTIFIRVETQENEDCYSIGNFEVCGYEAVAGQPDDLFLCAFGEEWSIFDLTQTEEDILGDQNPDDFSIHYYTSEEDAMAGDNAIENPTDYPADSSHQVIYFRLETSGLEGCITIGSFQIISQEMEIHELTGGLEVCTKTLINLPDLVAGLEIGEILGFYTSMENLLAENPIENPSNYRVGEADTYIYVLGSQNESDCDAVYIIPLRIVSCDIFIPEGFSPNADGVNDYFVIDNLEGYPNHKLQIYNRYGTRLFKGNKNTGFWDGNDNKGRRTPSATYYYVLDLGNQTKPIKGWVYLNR